MFKWIFVGLLIFSTALMAETKSYNVEGMTCDGCVKSVKAKVCTIKDIDKCDVEVGKVTLTSKGPIDDKTVGEAIMAAGYKVAHHQPGHAEKGEKMSCSGEGKGCTDCEHHKKGEACDHEGCKCDHHKKDTKDKKKKG